MTQEQINSLIPIEEVGSSIQTSALERGGFLFKREPSIWLPAPEYWLLPDEPIDTPTDKLGLVDVDGLIVAVKQTIDPSFDWSSRDSTHHFYWPSTAYSYDIQWGPNRKKFSEAAFRELPINKGELPRVFENWLHIMTLPPPKPSQEVMEYKIQGYTAAKSLFRSVREVIKWSRKTKRYFEGRTDLETDDEVALMKAAADEQRSREQLAAIIDRHFKGIEIHTKALEQVPPEFRLIEPSSSPYELATRLGRFVTKRSMKLGRKVYEPLVV